MNKDGSVVSYLQLAHNERHPVTGSPVAKVIHNFGRADKGCSQGKRKRCHEWILSEISAGDGPSDA